MTIDWLDITCPHCGCHRQVAVRDIISAAAEPRCDACGERLDLRGRSDREQRSTS